jgi:ADP-ribose pyrophosphatase
MRWQKLDARHVFKGWRHILRKTFLLPDGKTSAFDVLDAGNYVTVAAFTPDREVILVHQYRPGPERVLTSFVEGAVDKGEDPLLAGHRELREETGFVAEEMVHLRTFVSSYTTQQQICLLATGCKRQHTQALDDNEFIEVEIVPLATFRQQLCDPKNEALTNVDCAYLALEHMGWL